MVGLIEIIIYCIIILALGAASINDIKTREVPDWISYSMIISGFSIRLIFSTYYSEPSYILEGPLGFGVFLALSLLLFYTGMWGGGDSKLLMGLGSMLGLSYTSPIESFMPIFFMMTMFSGSIYGLIWSVILAFRNKKKFLKAFSAVFHDEKLRVYKKMLAAFLVSALILYAITFQAHTALLNAAYILLLALVILIFYAWIFSKAVELSCMQRLVSPKQLTEGDWIVNDVVVRGKKIAGPKDLGIEQRQIEQLKRLKVKKVLIKEGIPFVPAFFIAFVMTLLLKDEVVRILIALN